MYNNRIRNIELPENLFSNLGELKTKKIEIKEDPINITISSLINDYQFDTDVKLTNYSDRKEYRDRIDRMYEDIKEIIPIDNEIDNILYFNNYVEKGIVVKPKVSSLKQFWTEYRLINNEKTNPKFKLEKNNGSNEKENYALIEEKKHSLIEENNKNKINLQQEQVPAKELDSLDKLFEALSVRVSEINNYIEELKEMRISIDKTTKELQEDKVRLANERLKFDSYKEEEENKINKQKENLKINFDRLQTIIDDLDKKLVSIDKEI